MLSVNRRGVTRIVILTNRRAYKIPNFLSWRMFLKGLLCNMQERCMSTAHDDGIPICRVLWGVAGGWLVVMPRLRVMTDDEWELFDREEFTSRLGWSCLDLKPDNLGWESGRWALIDYG